MELKKYLETANINKLNDLKIYGINVGAVAFSVMPNINPALQTVVLIMTILYTGMNIYIKLKDRNKK